MSCGLTALLESRIVRLGRRCRMGGVRCGSGAGARPLGGGSLLDVCHVVLWCCGAVVQWCKWLCLHKADITMLPSHCPS